MEEIQESKKVKEEINNSALVVGLYNQDSYIPVANFFTINLLTSYTEDVTSYTEDCRYGDVTTTYIR